MYAAYFGLREAPFALTPDPGYLYLSPGHQEALAHLLYGVGENGGFVQLTGEIGTGKTTLIRALLAQCPANIDIALCLNPQLTVNEFVATLCDELAVPYPAGAGLKALIDALNRYLLAAHGSGRQTVVIIDEAQNLSHEVLEQVRLLTNLETHRHKLLRMILVGQPELQRQLARPELRQLAQRITARYHLRPLDRRQSIAYLQHRLRTAGGRPTLFTSVAQRLLHQYAGGLPRLLNILSDRALLGAYARDRQRVGASVIRRAAREVLATPGPRRRHWRRRVAVTGGILLLLAAGSLARNGPLPSLLSDTIPATRKPTLLHPIQARPVSDATLPRPAKPLPPHPQSPQARQGTELNARLAGSSPTAAWRQLLSLWRLDPELAAAADPCIAVQQHHLRCLRDQADWHLLRRFNRPALLSLQDSAGSRHQVLLRALDDNQATLVFGPTVLPVAVSRLHTLWDGTLLLLWRPATDARLLRPGNRGPAVAWLRRQLGEAATDPAAAPFDAALERRVRRFQQNHGLAVDGLVGTRTMLMLNNLTPTPATPVLHPASAGPG